MVRRLGRVGRLETVIAVALLTGGLLGTAWAAPVVSTVAGNVQNGQIISVQGSGFGASGPTVALFDDFEKGTNGQNIQLNLAQVGSWSGKMNNPKYSNLNVHGGTLAGRFDAQEIPSPCPNNCYNNIFVIFPPTKDVFVSAWYLSPSGEVFPGTGVQDGTNWKTIWVHGADSNDDDVFYVHNSEPGSDLLSYPSVGCNNCDNGCGSRWYPCGTTSKVAHGRWVRLQEWLHDADDQTGAIHIWETPWDSQDGGQMQRKNYNSTNVLRETGCGTPPCGFFERAVINAYNRPTPNCHPTYDDVYVAVGPNARARVEIASARTWGDNARASDMNMTLCTPTSWSATTVSCTVRQGTFANNSTAYLFVVAGNGEISDQDPSTSGYQGFPVTIGTSGPGDPPPPAPDSLRRTDTR